MYYGPKPAVIRLDDRLIPAALTLTTIGSASTLLWESASSTIDNLVTIGQISLFNMVTQETTHWIEVQDTAENMSCDITGAEQLTYGWRVKLGEITIIQAKCKEGNDIVNGSTTSIALNMVGYDGNDTLIGGGGDDYIDGGEG